MPATSGPLIEETVVLPATVESLVALQTTFDRFWQALDATPISHPDEVWHMEFVIALDEISSNIIRHAYADMAPGEMGLCLRLYPDRIVARLSDTGRAYSATTTTTAWDPNDLLTLPEGGMGLVIAKAALDILRYRRARSGFNCWRLTKRLPV